MISASEYLKRLQTVNNSVVLEGFVDDIVVSDTNVLVKEKIREFTLGQRPDESVIGTYKDNDYASVKYFMNPSANGQVDLMLTHSFVNGLHIDKFFRKEYIFNSTDWKTDKLIGKYGIDILGINPEFWKRRQIDVYRLTFVQMIKNTAKIA